MKQTTFTKQIRTLRKKYSYTQADVSRMLNIQRQTYCNYENATRTPPLEIIVALADLYHVSVDYLVCGTEPAEQTAPTLNRLEKRLLNEFSVLPKQTQKEVLEFVRFKKYFSNQRTL